MYTPKLMYHTINLNSMVPQDNFYRKLKQVLDLNFLYKETESYYGTEGQESIDPVVFFKICLVGYLNNNNSDRRLIEYCSNCCDIRLFLHYDLDEPLPWHSTISRTRQLYGEEVFLSLFKKVLSLCIEKGMVRGKRQVIDSAFVKANASLDSLVKKEVLEDAEDYCQELNEQSEYKIEEIKKEQHKKNDTHYSPTDPDARISVKPGKAANLNYFGQIAVDDANHVITGAGGDFADKKDSQCLPKILDQSIKNLAENHIEISEVIADTNYSSGESLRFCEKNGINAFIPNTGSFKPFREGFRYDEQRDCFLCTRGNQSVLSCKGITVGKKGHFRKIYLNKVKDCSSCSFKKECVTRKGIKKIAVTTEKVYYQKMHEKMETPYARYLMKVRKRTVEPVLGSLINYFGMKRVNSRGIHQATKHVIMAALCYNLKKYMRYIQKKTKGIGMKNFSNYFEFLSHFRTQLSSEIQFFSDFRLAIPFFTNDCK